ncbi:hypothetical protein FCV25MIE_22362 [Fagus crenata]
MIRHHPSVNNHVEVGHLIRRAGTFLAKSPAFAKTCWKGNLTGLDPNTASPWKRKVSFGLSAVKLSSGVVVGSRRFLRRVKSPKPNSLC